jgi:hypothetical protein
VIVPPTPSGRDRSSTAVVPRGGPDFTERELVLLRLVRPHLAGPHARRDREPRGEPNLTPRRWEILRQDHRGKATPRSPARWDCRRRPCVSI